MPITSRAVPWAEQPAAAWQIDRSSSLSRGLRRILLPSAAPGYEAAIGVLESLSGSVASVPTELGLATAFDDTSKYLVLDHWAADLSGGGCMMVGAVPLVGSTLGSYVMSARVGSGARAYIRRVAGSNWSYGFDGSVITAAGSDSLWLQGVYGLASLQWSTGAHEFYFNGTLRASGAGASLSPTTLMLNGLSSNPTNTSNRESNQTVFAAVWDRMLTADEQALMWRNPWQLFAPRRIWVPMTAPSGLPSLSAVTYKPGTLTSSGFTIRATAT